MRASVRLVTVAGIAVGSLSPASLAFAATTTNAMHAFSYTAQAPASNGQTTLVASNGAAVTVPGAVAAALKADRASAGLGAVPTASANDLQRRRTSRHCNATRYGHWLLRIIIDIRDREPVGRGVMVYQLEG